MFSVLSTLVQQPVAEQQATSHSHPADLYEVQRMVDAALHDLSSQLGPAGALEGVMHVMGIDHLDTVKDETGNTILTRMQHETAEYVQKIKRLMTEIEIMDASSRGE